jgi:hypothetical protein
MLIKSLEDMETIVENNKSLSWDGWTVIELTKSATAWANANSKFVEGQWMSCNRFEPNEDGWNLPSKLITKNVKR